MRGRECRDSVPELAVDEAQLRVEKWGGIHDVQTPQCGDFVVGYINSAVEEAGENESEKRTPSSSRRYK